MEDSDIPTAARIKNFVMRKGGASSAFGRSAGHGTAHHLPTTTDRLPKCAITHERYVNLLWNCENVKLWKCAIMKILPSRHTLHFTCGRRRKPSRERGRAQWPWARARCAGDSPAATGQRHRAIPRPAPRARGIPPSSGPACRGNRRP